MARRLFKPGDELPTRLFGAWRLHERLGSGANGEVWLAQSRLGALEAAVKIMTRFGPDGYDRFKREVGTLERMLLTDLAVLIVFDAYLPAQASRYDPPWYCMPVGTRISHALQGAAPRAVVRAIRGIAETLARLAAEHGINHRDIKPENLFFLDGRPVIGDFGLVLRADDEPLTAEGDVIGGPRDYVPDEVRFRRPDIDWERVDVYCLVKTLWVLIAGEELPPAGRIRAGGFFSLEQQPAVEEAHLNELDAIIDRATAEDPSERFTMAGFAQAIGDWLEALELREAVVAADVRARENKDATLRWLLSWSQTTDANFGRGIIDLGPPESTSVVPDLTNAELAEALHELERLGMIEGEPVMGQGVHPVAWSKVFPRFWAIEEIEDQRAIEARVAPVLRYLFDHPGESVHLGEVANVQLGAEMTGPTAYYRLRYLHGRGWVEFDELAEGGPGKTLMNLRVTDSGLAWIAAR